ncbi:meprin A subunit alpha [Bombina bombina]|uniref:meprin A subunit alpha n=1 Tax=Bombina bombina TaxID=8345 RepID=UPI00235AA9C9|nr:meprin A subunit alpha [Bombina bombina]
MVNDQSHVLSDLEKNMKLAQTKLQDLEDRSRCNNLKMIGLPEKQEFADLLYFAAIILPKALGAQQQFLPIKIERAHRMGSQRVNSAGLSQNRPITIKFLNYQDKMNLLRLYETQENPKAWSGQGGIGNLQSSEVSNRNPNLKFHADGRILQARTVEQENLNKWSGNKGKWSYTIKFTERKHTQERNPNTGQKMITHNKEGNENDIDAGELRKDIPQINIEAGVNLFEGDIMLPKSRNALRDDFYRWTFPIPYILADNLDLNAKGVILKSFEMFRLKSCVDFKPYEGESTYIHFQKFGGCWSMVGNLKTGQNLSIGERCDYKAIVEHEILHALGFYHEQSRTDRDDYVEIWWAEITEGMAHNFNKYDDYLITDLNTPYDYESVMHYGPLSFNKNENVPTITAKIPSFNDIIGQRLDLSEIDLERLNRMYNCTSSHTLLDQCSFELSNICGMVQGSTDNADWLHVISTPGTQEDHTLAGRCRDAGYFMHFDTHSGNIGRTALLESRILYPKRTEQCLQFFYKMNGNPNDKLIIWIRIDDGTGTVRTMKKIQTIQGDHDHNWKIAHVTLNANKKFRYVFQAIQGDDKTSNGGILLDDITLMETTCPNAVWTIRNFSQILAGTSKGDKIASPRFYSPEGYGYGINLFPHGPLTSTYVNYTGIFFHLCSGENDEVLEWPALNRQAIMTVLDQDPDIKLRMSSSRSFTTNKDQVIAHMNNISYWEKPFLTGTYDPSCDCNRSVHFGWSTFISHAQLKRRSFLKNDDLFIFVDFVDLTHLIKTEVPIKPVTTIQPAADEVAVERSKRSVENIEDLCDPSPCLNGGICVNENGKASCRCSSSKAYFYMGEQCESIQVHANVLGIMIGGAAGTIFLTISVLAIIRRR